MNETPYSPCGYYVLVKMEKFENKTKNGIILATPEQEKREQAGQCIGTIIAFGPTAYKGFEGCNGPEDWGVKIGDKFETARYAGKAVNHDDYKDYRLLTDQEITATIKEADNGN